MKKTLLFEVSVDERSIYLKWVSSILMLSMFLWAAKTNANGNQPISTIDGGTITGGPFEFCVGDGEADHVSGVELECNSTVNSQWVVTDEDGKILGLPPNPEAVNFDGAGEGTCLVWHLSYEDGLEGLDAGNNVSNLVGNYDFSNEIRVYRNQPEAGTLTGGPYAFTVDGTPDMVTGIDLTGPRAGANSSFVITDDQGKILGLPPSLDAVKGVNFDGAGAGTCFIYHLRYEDGLTGLAPDENLGDIYGCYDLSNAIEVVRTEGAVASDISGGPFAFCVDGTPDMVSGITLDGESTGSSSSWVITDDQGKILGLPPTLEAVEGVDFDGAGAGTCLIWYLRYEGELEGAEMGMNANDLKGNFDLSNPIYVVRSETEAGTLTGGPYAFTVDGTPDMVTGIDLTGPRAGANSSFVITDDQGKILGLPPSLDAVKGVNFDGAGAGTCFIYHLRYEDGLTGLAPDENLGDIYGCYDLSNGIEVVRTEGAVASDISGGPFAFCVDGTPDMVSGITLDGESTGSSSSWVITDDQGKILGLPPTLEAVEGVDFDGAGAGTCLIWYLRYEGELKGAEMGMNANDLKGNFDLSNPIYVVRSETEAGTLIGGPYAFTVDGTPDMVTGIDLTGPRAGANSSFVITDDQGKILGLPPSLDAVKGVNFDGAGAGTCFIYHLRYEDGLTGLVPDENLGDIYGCYDLSNAIEVVRTAETMVDGGTITGGPYNFCVDGYADHVSSVSISGAEGSNFAWVVTDTEGNILGLPPTPEAVNFDEAGPGVCLIWHISYEDGLEGLMGGNNVGDLSGTYDISDDYAKVTRNQPEAGTFTGGPYYFTVDGHPDMVSGLSLTGNRSGSNSTFVITDDQGKILGLPPSLEAVEGVDFDGAGAGTCFIYHLRYEDGLEGLAADENLSDIYGCYDLSNAIEVVRTEGAMVDGGTITGGPFEFCVGDGHADNVSGIEVSGSAGANAQWVVTDEAGNILGLPPTPEAVDFDGAGAGTCLIWYLRYEDGLEGLEGGNNVSALSGTFDFSNEIPVYRHQPDAGTLTGGPFEFIVDEDSDMVSGLALTGSRSGSNSSFVITDDQGKILGLPPSIDAVQGVDFNGAGPGTCFIYHLRYEDGLEGLEPDSNIADLSGCYDFSNSIEVVRLSDTSSGKSAVSLYPLPAVDVVNVSSSSFDKKNVQMRLYDFAGNDISGKVRRIDSTDLSYDVQSLPSGIYFLSLRNSKGQAVTKKIVKK